MQLRRPLAALLTALALFGGGATMTACSGSDPTTPNEGTTDDDSENTSGNDPGGDEQDNVPNNSDPDPGNEEDQNDDSTDPD
ncbi:hypothetical protein SAMN05660662_0289 [Blastococcus aurantiacus]|uniref:Uncharacterized protein n=1 Tax=Blastococcus aurantiacus TaxID=1550231 RepID=A0A1G7RE33_9ACTN|nr:hypothetical protein [Blastococcus aurantiacus]SDG09056.1 hypothetical protein SAMN05660662_0289 [Blastococcus aurantiacus]